MADDPPATLLIAEVRSLLEKGIPDTFQQKVAANALGIALRELGNQGLIPGLVKSSW